MKHWVKIDNSSGTHTFVGSDDSMHPTQQGEPTKGFKYVQLERVPNEHEYFDGKQLKMGVETKVLSDYTSKLNAFTREELVDFILDMFDQRLIHHGLISMQDNK